jgi:hypothetical protein
MAKQKRRGKGGVQIFFPKVSTPQPDIVTPKAEDKTRTSTARTRKKARGLRLEFLILLPSLLLAIFLYVNTLQGQFVCDDKPQIEPNTLIQDSLNIWRAVFF